MEVRAGLQILMLRSPYPELPLWPYPMDQMVTSLVNLLVEKITIGDAPLKQSLLPRFFFVPRSSGKYLIRIDLMHLNRFIPSPQFFNEQSTSSSESAWLPSIYVFSRYRRCISTIVTSSNYLQVYSSHLQQETKFFRTLPFGITNSPKTFTS